MILFLNTFVPGPTSWHPHHGSHYDPGLARQPRDRLEIFQYMLVSLGQVDWTRVVLYYDIDEAFEPRRAETEAIMRASFADPEIHRFRVDTPAGWREAIEDLRRGRVQAREDLIWFSCDDIQIYLNHDPVFMANLCAVLRRLERDYQYVELNLSHWPSACENLYTQTLIEDHDDYFVHTNVLANSRQIVNFPLLEQVFLARDYGAERVIRADNQPSHLNWPHTACVVPKRELVRRFHGYAHCGIDIDLCPPLEIPPGFWERDIRLRFGEVRKPGHTWIWPLADAASCVDPAGADLRGLPEDVPTFWKDRITEWVVDDDPARPDLEMARNRQMLEMIGATCRRPIEELARDFPGALRGERRVGPDTEPGGARARDPHGAVHVQKRDVATSPVVHSLILLDHEDLLQDDLPLLREVAGPNERVQILWVTLGRSRGAKLRRLPEIEPADWIGHYHYDDPLHKHHALNWALARCRGEIVTVCEAPYAGLRLCAGFLDVVEASFRDGSEAGSGLRSTVVRHALWELQACAERAAEGEVDAIATRFQTCVSFLWRDAIEAGGYDEGQRYAGALGGAFELARRLEWSGIRRLDTQGVGVSYLSIPRAARGLPCSEFAEKLTASPPRLEAEVANPAIERLRAELTKRPPADPAKRRRHASGEGRALGPVMECP